MNKKQIIVLVIVIISIIGNIICLIMAGATLAIHNAKKVTSINLDSNITKVYDSTTTNLNDYFDGSFSYSVDNTSIKIFNFQAPNEFDEKDNEYYYEAEKEIDGEKIINECSFSIKEITNYDDVKKLVYSMNDFYGRENEVQNQLINNINWYGIKYDFFGTNYNYLTEINQRIFIYDFKIDNITLINECENYKDNILNSISLK